MTAPLLGYLHHPGFVSYEAMPYEVYVVRHLQSGREYVGMTRVGLKRRWQSHCAGAARALYPLQQAIGRFGRAAFFIEHVATVVGERAARDAEAGEIERRRCLWPAGFNLFVARSRLRPAA